jgi:hypothetical protein
VGGAEPPTPSFYRSELAFPFAKEKDRSGREKERAKDKGLLRKEQTAELKKPFGCPMTSIIDYRFLQHTVTF